MTPALEDRFAGCLLGHALGDAVGAPFEGLPPETIYYDFGPTRRLFDQPPADLALVYTDDTQMTLGVAEWLLAGAADDEGLIRQFRQNYEDWRGYGPGMRKLFDALARGMDWRQTAATLFPGGSLGNGAAMRAAPVGLLFHDDVDRVAAEARRSAAVTHTHPIGIDGAVLVAVGVALALRSSGAPFDARRFFHELSRRANTEEFQWQLRAAARQGPDDSLSFGNSLEAHRSVTTALLCFAHNPDDYAGAVSRAIAMGNDTDTLAAMAGALSGARLGAGVLPEPLLSRLEDGRKGRTYIRSVALRLHELATARPPRA